MESRGDDWRLASEKPFCCVGIRMRVFVTGPARRGGACTPRTSIRNFRLILSDDGFQIPLAGPCACLTAPGASGLLTFCRGPFRETRRRARADLVLEGRIPDR